jgi:hypothetical protein
MQGSSWRIKGFHVGFIKYHDREIKDIAVANIQGDVSTIHNRTEPPKHTNTLDGMNPHVWPQIVLLQQQQQCLPPKVVGMTGTRESEHRRKMYNKQ